MTHSTPSNRNEMTFQSFSIKARPNKAKVVTIGDLIGEAKKRELQNFADSLHNKALRA
jgi:hypothetical protein